MPPHTTEKEVKGDVVATTVLVAILSATSIDSCKSGQYVWHGHYVLPFVSSFDFPPQFNSFQGCAVAVCGVATLARQSSIATVLSSQCSATIIDTSIFAVASERQQQ